MWWTTGVYWVISGGQELIENASILYWCSCFLLAWDCICVVSFVAIICSIILSFAWCLPSFYDIMHLVASEDDVASDTNIIIRLAKYRYTEASTRSSTVGKGTMIPIASKTGTMTTPKRVILHEDAKCCICLAAYKEGTMLHALPCKHHFHSGCIIKWLRIKAICPLCKFNIQAMGN
ncbi:RING finger protein [Rhynchospora pubera]|uniref:RING-type E3 ubiquitin transferase n=1 Tax=Rhynchospora pubera TaxID=906938 RepID=A0AAV8H5V5_9POAL|nr:RING finger protein [Rhynchospora pubera]